MKWTRLELTRKIPYNKFGHVASTALYYAFIFAVIGLILSLTNIFSILHIGIDNKDISAKLGLRDTVNDNTVGLIQRRIWNSH